MTGKIRNGRGSFPADSKAAQAAFLIARGEHMVSWIFVPLALFVGVLFGILIVALWESDNN